MVILNFDPFSDSLDCRRKPTDGNKLVAFSFERCPRSSKHRIAFTTVGIHKSFSRRHAPGSARTCNPMIRSYIVRLAENYRKKTASARPSMKKLAIWAQKCRRTTTYKQRRTIESAGDFRPVRALGRQAER